MSPACRYTSIIILLLSGVNALPENCYDESISMEQVQFQGDSSILKIRPVSRGSNVFLRCPIRESSMKISYKIFWRHGRSMLKLRPLRTSSPCLQVVVNDNSLSLDIDLKFETESFFGCVVYDFTTNSLIKESLIFISFYEPILLSTKYSLIVKTDDCSDSSADFLRRTIWPAMTNYCKACKLNVSVECKGERFPFEIGKFVKVVGGEKLTLHEGGRAAELENLEIGNFVLIANITSWSSASEVSFEGKIPFFSSGRVKMVKRVIFRISFKRRKITVDRQDLGDGGKVYNIEVPEKISKLAFLDIGIEFRFDSLRLLFCFKPILNSACEKTFISLILLPGATTIIPDIEKIFLSGHIEVHHLEVLLFRRPFNDWTKGPRKWAAVTNNFFGRSFRYSQFESEKFKVMSITKVNQSPETHDRTHHFAVISSVSLERGKRIVVDVTLDLAFFNEFRKSNIRLSYTKDFLDYFTQVAITCSSLKCEITMTDTFSPSKTTNIPMTEVYKMDDVLNVAFVISAPTKLLFVQNIQIDKANYSAEGVKLANVIVKVEVGNTNFEKDNHISVSSSIIGGNDDLKTTTPKLLKATDIYFRQALDINEFTPILGAKYIKVTLSLEDQDISHILLNIPPSCHYIDCSQAIIIENLRRSFFKAFLSEVSDVIKPFATDPIVKQIEQVRYKCPDKYFSFETGFLLCQKCHPGTQALTLTGSSNYVCKPCSKRTYQTEIGQRCLPCEKQTKEEEGKIFWTSCMVSNDTEEAEFTEVENAEKKDSDRQKLVNKFAWRPSTVSVIFNMIPQVMMLSLTAGLFLIFMTKTVVRFLHF